MPPSSVAATATTIWNLLGLAPGTAKDEIRQRYKKFVRTEHPDVKGTSGDPSARERWTQITHSYREIMQADEDVFWLESWCARVAAITLAREDAWRKRREAKIAALEEKEAAEWEAAQRDVAENGYGEEAKPNPMAVYHIFAAVAITLGSVLTLTFAHLVVWMITHPQG